MKNEISIFEFLKKFPDERSCHQFIENSRWPTGVNCPHCSSHRIYWLKNQSRYKCGSCRKQFSIRTGTILAESKIPLQKRLMVAWILTSHRKGIGGGPQKLDKVLSYMSDSPDGGIDNGKNQKEAQSTV